MGDMQLVGGRNVGLFRFEPGPICLFKKNGILLGCSQLVTDSVTDLFTKHCAICYHVHVTMHIKDHLLSNVRAFCHVSRLLSVPM